MEGWLFMWFSIDIMRRVVIERGVIQRVVMHGEGVAIGGWYIVGWLFIFLACSVEEC